MSGLARSQQLRLPVSPMLQSLIRSGRAAVRISSVNGDSADLGCAVAQLGERANR